jgi:predicted nucleic acid-binding protein
LILIVDSSILISALIKDSVTREILLLPFFEFLLPEYSLQEVEFRKNKISKLSGLSEDEIDIVLSLILENISIIPAQKIKAHFNEANNFIGKVDPNDIPFVALALATENDGIWSNDKDFEVLKDIKVWKTTDIISYINK